eukprot:TRINITY_DN3469_c0_g1_i1.p1 TRINITY_DN3469_c0_g1~~TRINITY_DN3469_c0_g1_i1.p1  ORF type:complete len:206 (-),score=33.57 TRINITY_DN3469_c0_g1_i1:280-897(-)
MATTNCFSKSNEPYDSGGPTKDTKPGTTRTGRARNSAGGPTPTLRTGRQLTGPPQLRHHYHVHHYTTTTTTTTSTPNTTAALQTSSTYEPIVILSPRRRRAVISDELAAQPLPWQFVDKEELLRELTHELATVDAEFDRMHAQYLRNREPNVNAADSAADESPRITSTPPRSSSTATPSPDATHASASSSTDDPVVPDKKKEADK